MPLNNFKRLPVKIGQRVKFRPFEHMHTMGDAINGEELLSELIVEGTVVSINEPHRWFSVEWGKPKRRASFKFTDIGKLSDRRNAGDYPKYVEIID